MRIWVENSTDPQHGGEGWGYGEVLWAPQWNSGGEGKSSAVHTRIGQVKDGDLVVHIRQIAGVPYLDGFSTADGNGGLTTEAPPLPGEWEAPETWPSGEPRRYFRANLRGFTEFETDPSKKLRLDQFFADYALELEQHREDKTGSGFFYSRKKSGGVQRAQGYLHTADEYLLSLIRRAVSLDFKDPDYVADKDQPFLDPENVTTGERMAFVATRKGQQKLARQAKALYGNECCFPGCDVSEPAFLVGAHIVRWSDDETLRGEMRNVLCLCAMHDIGFERGIWWIDEQGRVAIDPARINSSTLRASIASGAGQELSTPLEETAIPLREYFDAHRKRVC